MVDDLVVREIKDHLISRFGEEAESLIDYAFSCKILDKNKCRIAVIKKYYKSMLEDHSAGEAKILTAETFCISEKHVENIIYNEFYKAISLNI
jgi:hypothetical protein